MTGKADASGEELLMLTSARSRPSAEGVDLLVAETMMSENEATAARDAVLSFGLPLMVTMTVEADGSFCRRQCLLTARPF